jgi:hypothetical protein
MHRRGRGEQPTSDVGGGLLWRGVGKSRSPRAVGASSDRRWIRGGRALTNGPRVRERALDQWASMGVRVIRLG